MTNHHKPTEAELEILQVLWQNGPCTVRAVNDSLNEKRKVGYTTTLKLMQIMTEKKMLVRTASGRGHVYETVYREQETQKLVLDRVLDLAFGGSAMKLVMRALGGRNNSKEDLRQIRAYLDEIEKGDK